MATPLTILTKLTQRIRKGFLWISALSLFVTAITIFMMRSIKAEYGAYAKIFPLSINNKSGSASPTEALRAQFGISDRTDYDKIYNIRELVNSRTVSESIARSKPASGPYHSMAEWLIADYNNNKPFWKKNISWDTHDSNTLYYTGASVLLDNTDVNADVKTGFTTITTG